MLLALVMVLGVLPMLASAEASGTVRILAAVTGGKDADEMQLWVNALSEATGLTIEVERPASDYDTILMQKLSAGESYDLIYVGASQYANLVEQGALTDITEKVQASRILPKTCLPANGRTSPWTARSTRASTSASCTSS